MCVAGQQFRNKNGFMFPPAGQTIESKAPNVCIQEDAATIDGLWRSSWLTFFYIFGVQFIIAIQYQYHWWVHFLNTGIFCGSKVWTHKDSTASRIIDPWLKLVMTASISVLKPSLLLFILISIPERKRNGAKRIRVCEFSSATKAICDALAQIAVWKKAIRLIFHIIPCSNGGSLMKYFYLYTETEIFVPDSGFDNLLFFV